MSQQVDDRLRVSLGNLPEWDFQRDFKKTTSVNSKEPNSATATATVTSSLSTNKVNSATALEPMRTFDLKKPPSFEGSPTKGYYGENQPRKVTTPVANGSDTSDFKRKGILEEHAFCLQGMRVAVDFIKSEDRDCMAFCHILLKKAEERLKKICESVDVTEIEYQDIIMAINNELRQIER